MPVRIELMMMTNTWGNIMTETSFCLQKLPSPCWRYTMLQRITSLPYACWITANRCVWNYNMPFEIHRFA